LAAFQLCDRRNRSACVSLEEKSVEGAPRFWHWWVLPWPWSQLVLECSPKTLLALAALPVLAAALVISWAFRWVSLLWTGMINLALITLLHYLLGVLDTFPIPSRGYARPVSGSPHLFAILKMPPPVMELLIFSGFLFSAWLGCRSPRPASELARQTMS